MSVLGAGVGKLDNPARLKIGGSVKVCTKAMAGRKVGHKKAYFHTNFRKSGRGKESSWPYNRFCGRTVGVIKNRVFQACKWEMSVDREWESKNDE